MMDEKLIWGNTLLPVVLDAIGGAWGKVIGVGLHAEYGKNATVTFMRQGYYDTDHVLPQRGTEWLSAVLGAPKGLQAITVDIREGSFVTCHCRYAPIEASMDELVAALKATENVAAEISQDA